MSRPIRAAACCVLSAVLAACATTPQTPPPAPRPVPVAPAPRPVPAPRPAPRPAPAPAPAPTPEPAPVQPAPPNPARERMQQTEQRIDQLRRHIDARVASGRLQAPDADALRHRLDVIRQEATDMAAPHGSGLSVDEQHILNQELDTAARAIDQ